MNTYLSTHQSTDKSACTHTRIGSTEHNVYGGSYSISDLREFYPLYYKHVFERGQPEHLTEKQFEKGPLAIDLDFRYAEPKRMYTKEHIIDFIEVLIFEMYRLFNVHGDFSIYVFEKPNINCTPKCIKDGIHMIVGLNLDTASKTVLRNHLLPKMDIWNALKLTNDWASVLDEGVFKGTTGWQLYGSRKPGHEAYELTHIFTCTKNGNDFDLQSASGKTFPLQTDFYKLSVRNLDHEEIILKDEFKKEAEDSRVKRRVRVINTDTVSDAEIKSTEQLTASVDKFISSLDPNEYMLSEAYYYAMSLPPEFYDVYEKWIRVGWALHHTDKRLFIVWLKFSSQSAKFSFDMVSKLQKDWEHFKHGDGITIRSLMYWSKMNNPTEYDAIKEKSVDAAVEVIIRESMCAEFDIAELLYRMYKDLYVCVNIKQHKWFKYVENRWIENDSGTDLRKEITSQKGIYGIFHAKRMVVHNTIGSLQPDDDRKKELEKKRSKIEGIMINMLKKQGDKIMKEASHKFYCPNFFQMLDSKAEILCFTNGVIDFSTNTFRQGLPEDYTRKHTKIPYIPLTECNSETVKEIHAFMKQLFPDDELCEYMWNHLASICVGKNNNQTFNIYIGCGANGKSRLVDLVSEAFGEYRATVPISLVTRPRVGVGGASPEVAALVGIRYAVMQESSVNDALNEGALKELTGGDTLICRNLYCDPISFIPMFKLVMSTNNLPAVNGKDAGTWRRICAVPFNSTFKENPDTSSKYQFPIDKTLDAKFPKWKVVFMSMLIDIAFRTKGMVHICEMVKVNSDKYRKDQDYLTSFVSDCMVVNPEAAITDRQISDKFKEWWKLLYGNNPPKGKELFDYIHKIYSEKPNIRRKGTTWKGLALINDEEEVVDNV